MNLGDMQRALIAGARITSPSWNGSNMYLYALPGDLPIGPPRPRALPVYVGPELGFTGPSVMLRDAKQRHYPWTLSQADFFRDDWQLAPGFWGEPVRAWGIDAVEIAKREKLLLTCLDRNEEPYTDQAPRIPKWMRWVYLPL